MYLYGEFSEKIIMSKPPIYWHTSINENYVKIILFRKYGNLCMISLVKFYYTHIICNILKKH